MLPENCLAIAAGTFALAIILDAGRDYMTRRLGSESAWVKLVPIPSMIGIPSFIGYRSHLCPARIWGNLLAATPMSKLDAAVSLC